MILNPQLGRDGRLGNQLFQQAAIEGLSLVKGYDIGTPPKLTMGHHGQAAPLEKFKIEPPPIKNIFDLESYSVYLEKNPMSYDPEFWDIEDNTFISGYFQSINYFRSAQDKIKKEFVPKDEYQEPESVFVDHISSINEDAEVVSIHLRRGDNTDGSNPSELLNNMYGKTQEDFWDSFYGKYLKSALDEFSEPEKYHFLIFTGGNRFTEDNSSDREWCRKVFSEGKFTISDSGDSIKDYCRIRACDHNILSHVSSFGWWAAYTKIKQGKVVAPYNYHPDILNFSYREGFYPEEWILV